MHNITLEQMKNFLRADKGWELEPFANEWLFQYRIKSLPCVIIKVATGISVDENEKINKNSENIRVFAVVEMDIALYTNGKKKYRGIVSAVKVIPNEYWQTWLQKKIGYVIMVAKERYNRFIK